MSYSSKNIRNVAIIAHVDHGKTTLVDGLLKQSKTFRENEAAFSQHLIMDSNDQERERGITILAKNTAIQYGEYKVNIIDTPGHADFGGEVERTLSMADGAILIIDAQEGPMPQTKFVLKKALDLGLKTMVMINKIDKPHADIKQTLDRTYDLFLELATKDDQLEFPIYYCIGREGKAWDHMPADMNEDADLDVIFKAIIDHVPTPKSEEEGDFQMLISALDRDNYQGKYVIGKIKRGRIKPGQNIVLIGTDTVFENGENIIKQRTENAKVEKVLVSVGLKKIEVEEAIAGDIVTLSGVKNANIGDTICDPGNIDALPTIDIEEPMLSIALFANTSPLAGREGKYVTGRQLLDRIKKELETNVSMRLSISDTNEYILAGRGELHLSVFIETLRREGYEMQVGKPHVITKMIDGVESEPIEELAIDVPAEYSSSITGEVGRRRGMLMFQQDNSDQSIRLTFEIPTRGLLGLRNQLLTLSRGTAVMSTIYLRHEPMGASIPTLRNGVLVASEAGKSMIFGLDNAQNRGTTFIHPQVEVYEGMIVGLHTRTDDIEINVVKEKRQSNVRAASADMATILTPPIIFSLEQCIDFLEDDELLEVTPTHLRLRKKILNTTERYKARKRS